MTFRLAASAAFMGLALSSAPAFAQASGADVLKALNKDGDNTLELAEVIDAGAKLFAVINPDGDTTLESGETKGRITEKDWKRYNKDGDQTLEMDEWLTILRARFNAANPDKDGSLDEKELNTKAGQLVVLMIMK
ncbi:hypothetical protein [Hansschlegelia sp. KR7-227]|uniref:hypothetical protein n=1 Tax=Hansschlegelia sp. KR7-227 TaxID=3400914 RepID=UPI003BFF7BBF